MFMIKDNKSSCSHWVRLLVPVTDRYNKVRFPAGIELQTCLYDIKEGIKTGMLPLRGYKIPIEQVDIFKVTKSLTYTAEPFDFNNLFTKKTKKKA